MSLRRCIVVLLMLLAFMPARAQTMYGYDFTTGVDSSMWITLTNPDTLRTYEQTLVDYSPFVELDFPFGFLGTEIHSISAHSFGCLICNRAENASPYGVSSWAYARRAPLISIFGCASLSYYYIFYSSMAVCQTVGSPGNRTFVCEFSIKSPSSSLEVCRYQLQLEEGTCALRMVYRHNIGSLTPAGQIGFTGTDNRFIMVDPATHTISTTLSGPIHSWPGDYRYYQFVPNCANLPRINISNVEQTSARVSWPRMRSDSRYLVRYGYADSGYVEQSTPDTVIYLQGLRPKTKCEVQVRVVCSNGDTSEAVSTFFWTLIPSCSNIPFTSLWDNHVKCRTGRFTDPSIMVEIVDDGYASINSRHTVHYDTSERDPRTGNLLRTIPVGHCSSVRLGNWMNGSEQEDITYSIVVDTNQYDLLILRYAIVVQNPNHNAQDQPHVIFSICDSNDIVIDSCYYANFVSGDLSDWNNMAGGLWRDWSAFGVDLSNLHGQRVKVSISNYDCAYGGHYGYTYFTLEGAMKRLQATNCGSVLENTFHAPQGFNYRWYNTSNPYVTLSTTDSLHVTSAGNYSCYATYQLQGRDCGFVMSTRSGPRYPVAQFTISMIDGCSAVRRFINQSVVATDAEHTNLTNEPCEKYLWRFSDGTVDSSTSITRTFRNGTYSVTLLAMLADGTCVDSVTQTFTVNIPIDTLNITLCPGFYYQFGDELFTDTGKYVCVANCMENVIFFRWHTLSSQTYLIDTICSGDTLFYNMLIATESGYYRQMFHDHNGCDSLVYLDLTCLPTYRQVISDTLPADAYYSIDDTAFRAPGSYRLSYSSQYGCDSLIDIYLSCTKAVDTTVCEADLPLMWGGRMYSGAGTHRTSYRTQSGNDSIVTYTMYVQERVVPQMEIDQDCDSGSYFIVRVEGDYHFEWESEFGDGSVEEVVADSLYYLHPQQPTRYYLYASHRDGLPCTVVESIDLDPADLVSVNVDFSMTPEVITSETFSLVLLDQSQNIQRREWYVDSVLQMETVAQLPLAIPMDVDTLELCLVGYRTFCFQKVCKYVPIHRHSLYFPNVFTPDGDINNRFTAIGVGIAEFEMWIYDRRGALMFHTTDMQQGWDGTSKGIKCRQEAYAYTCRYRLKQEQGYQTHTGTVLLLR